jgi:hypothetical protein
MGGASGVDAQAGVPRTSAYKYAAFYTSALPELVYCVLACYGRRN